MDDHSKRAVLRWWRSMMLSAVKLKEMHIQPASTSHKAQLRRCESADTAMLTEGFRELWLNLSDEITQSNNSTDIECWATIAVALVYVKSESKNKLAVAAGKKGNGDKSVVSELRFSQLQNAKTSEEFLRRLRRIIQQVKGDVSALNLAEDIHQWFAEHGQLRPRKADKRVSVKWAMDYYQAASSKAK